VAVISATKKSSVQSLVLVLPTSFIFAAYSLPQRKTVRIVINKTCYIIKKITTFDTAKIKRILMTLTAM